MVFLPREILSMIIKLMLRGILRKRVGNAQKNLDRKLCFPELLRRRTQLFTWQSTPVTWVHDICNEDYRHKWTFHKDVTKEANALFVKSWFIKRVFVEETQSFFDVYGEVIRDNSLTLTHVFEPTHSMELG